uniref:Retrotransposon gag domain-containing protein n=1 Tax=Tanacetum cinerariifolium TaxID=118510 RepID=A0A6L2K5K9_TANCI|nr:hypothetical protein [Tanacetum cinerariifolium]
MEDTNPIRTLGDYSKPSHEGYRNPIELPVGNNVVPLRSDTIRERTRMRLFQFSLRDQASNWLEHLLAGSITTWEDLTTRFLAQLFPPGRTTKLHNDILMFQQHHEESLSKLRDINAEESWAFLEDLTLYDNKSWNDPRDFTKLVKAISMPQDVLSTSDLNKITTSSEICNGPHDTQYCMEDLEQAFVEYASLRTDEAGGEEEAPYWTTLGKRESYKPRPSSNGIGVQTHYYARTDFLDCHLPGEWEIARDAEINPFKDVLVFRQMVEFIGALPINLKRNTWESKDLIENPINWDKPPIYGDGAWHAKIRIIDPHGEKFTKTLQSILTTRKLSERESPKKIINLEHFYDT